MKCDHDAADIQIFRLRKHSDGKHRAADVLIRVRCHCGYMRFADGRDSDEYQAIHAKRVSDQRRSVKQAAQASRLAHEYDVRRKRYA